MKNHHSAMPLFIVLLVVLAGLGVVTLARGGADSSVNSGRNNALERDRQTDYAALEEKVDRLTYLMQSVPSGERTSNRAGTRAHATAPEHMTPQQAQARQAQIKADLDKRFETQPVDANWSLESTRRIERSLSADGLKEIGAQPPSASRIDCRSSMCRIHLVYGDNGSASDAGMMLNVAIADRMPYTQVLSQARTDGGVDYFIYAMRGHSR
ncbi:hypothetical protein M2650_09465 [Luteimonas sp. SX5]|uniref:Uncharacterized protein n=1 Tax=Luteimonas galliterrae TaxID=2940486 RepID=A0ABT0MJP8_9GAMM|nr:hypothetical protein [Luteimonas galliterrae]MCL1634858.1 hypothetical protein [Luteimonas galliterrae]